MRRSLADLKGHVRKGKLTGLALGATALAVGVIAAAPAGSAVTESATTSTPTIVIDPGVIHPVGGMPRHRRLQLDQPGAMSTKRL